MTGEAMYLLYFIVSLLASGFGGICGIGGGVIIKPVLDATGTMSVSNISFLSGCTVLSMSVISVLRNRKSQDVLDIGTSTPLAIGAVFGGIFGKSIFDLIKTLMHNENHVGAVQAGILILITLGSLLYSIYSPKIHTHQVQGKFAGIAIGMALGMISTFLGIGGGPINLTVLFFFFSMDTKKAAANSLYIIMFSQAASLVQSFIGGKIPTVSIWLLVLMVLAGFIGGIFGGQINKKVSAAAVDKLFAGFMALIVGISVYNLCRFIII